MRHMSLNALLNVSPIDGRYSRQVESLSGYFSEYALIKYRVRVEIEYFAALCRIPLKELEGFCIEQNIEKLRAIYLNFTPENAARIKEIEKVTNHDVKAVEYFIKERFKENGWEAYQEFGCSPYASLSGKEGEDAWRFRKHFCRSLLRETI